MFFMQDKTSIAISREIRNQLAAIGTKDSTFDEIIQKLLTKWNRKIGQTSQSKKENDFDLRILAEEKLRENESKHFVQKNPFHEVQITQEASTEIDINQSNFEITKQHLFEKLAVEDSVEYTKTINSCAYICKEKTRYGSQQSVRNYIDILTCEEAPFMISKNDEKKKIIVKRCDN